MRRSPLSASCLPRPAITWAGPLALLVLAGSCLLVRAQNSGPNPAAFEAPSAAFPCAPSITAQSSTGLNATMGSIGVGRQMALATNVGQPGPFGFSPFGSPGSAQRQSTPAPLFPIGGNTSRSLAAGTSGPFALPPAPQPSLNQLMRSTFGVPLNGPSTSFKLSLQDTFRTAGAFAGPARPAAGLFTTTDLGNGMLLTAGTTLGSHSMAGAPAATLPNGTASAPRHSGPSLGLKLSF